MYHNSKKNNGENKSDLFYDIVIASNFRELIKKVNAFLAEYPGWEPTGGLLKDGIHIGQAVYRKSKEDGIPIESMEWW